MKVPYRSESGSVIVEFVLIAPVFLLLLFGIMQFGLALNAKLVLMSAAREGARRAAVEGGATKAVYQKIEQQLSLGNIDPDSVEVSISPWVAPYGNTIRVRLTYNYPIVVPMLRTLLGNSLPLRAEVIIRSEKVSGA